MKKIIAFSIVSWFFALAGYKAVAQTKEPADKKVGQEIIIKKKGDKDEKLTIEFKDNKVLINGKPMVEFNDDEISINNRKIIINGKRLESDIDNMMQNFNFAPGYDFQIDSMIGNMSSGPFLGVSFENVKEGAKILNVTKGSPAEKAGLQKDDIITQFDGNKVEDGENNLAALVNKTKVKDEVKIEYLRNGKKKKTKAEIEANKEFSFRGFTRTPGVSRGHMFRAPETPAFPPDNFWYNNTKRKKIGLKIQDTEDGKGIKVIDVEDSTAAASAGIQKDDILLEINGEKINNTDDAREALRSNDEMFTYPVKLLRNGTEMNVTIKIPRKLKTVDL